MEKCTKKTNQWKNSKIRSPLDRIGRNNYHIFHLLRKTKSWQKIKKILNENGQEINVQTEIIKEPHNFWWKIVYNQIRQQSINFGDDENIPKLNTEQKEQCDSREMWCSNETT